MNNQDWERFGEDIRRTIQDAVEYGNYDRLNQTITNTLNQATDWVSRNMRGAQSQRDFYQQPNYQGSTYQGNVYQQPVVKRDMSELYEVKSSSKVRDILFTVFGLVAGVPVLGVTIFLVIGALITEGLLGILWALLIMIFPLGIFSVMTFLGVRGVARIRRFKKYVKEIGTAEFCKIEDLVDSVQRSSKSVLRDLEYMINKGWFKEGHLDQKKTCLITTDEMYGQYQRLEEQQARLREDEKAKQRAQQEQADSRKGLAPEVQKVIEQGDMYVKKIRECNDRIPGEEISKKIDHMEMVVDKIFDRVEQNPELVSDVRKLMEYYLPTTIKLLEAYAEMDAQPVGGENIQTAKREIEATLDTLNVAFEKLLDSLFMDAAWDVSSDISVLNTMLAQEGLKDDGLKK